jgi:G:T/U-mismatch repair DNA glycosylase
MLAKYLDVNVAVKLLAEAVDQGLVACKTTKVNSSAQQVELARVYQVRFLTRRQVDIILTTTTTTKIGWSQSH